MSSTNPGAVLPARERGSNSYVRFIVMCGGRTGSFMLGTSLNYNPHIVCFGEIFNPGLDFVDYHIDGYDDHRADDLKQRQNDVHGFLEERIFCSYPDETRAVGFKAPVSYLWLIPDVLKWLVAEKDVRVLHLQRHNLLRMLVSEKIAVATGGWTDYQGHTFASLRDPANVLKTLRHPLRAAAALRSLVRSREPDWKASRSKLLLTEEECKDYFASTAANVTKYDERFDEHPKMTVYYEDLVDNYDETLDQVQTFLGQKPKRLVPATRRQNPEPLRELIENYDDLCEAFKNTPEAAFFD